MIEIPTSRRRLRRGFGCLAVVALAPMMFGCLNIAWIKIGPFAPVVFGLLVAVVGVYLWLGRQRA